MAQKANIQRLIFRILIIQISSLFVNAIPNSWEYAISSKTKIAFYDEHWQMVTTSAHQFEDISALTFDEAEDVVYFHDLMHNNHSIFSLKIPISSKDQSLIESVVQRTSNETIRGLAYDPLNRNLYWSDMIQRRIYFMSVDMAAKLGEAAAAADAALLNAASAAGVFAPQIFLDLSQEEAKPDGLALDICGRKLYWTNSNFKNASIERIGLDGSGRELLINTDLYLPHGIAVDQFTERIYFVVDQPGVHYSVESAKLDGSARAVIVRGVNNEPYNLAITNDAIYWTDLTHNVVWKYPKFVNETDAANTVAAAAAAAAPTPTAAANKIVPEKILTGLKFVRGIVTRTHFYQRLQSKPRCKNVVAKITQRLVQTRAARPTLNTELAKMHAEYCLNDGIYVKESGVCICKMGFKGARCENSECHNYCVHGTCAISNMGFPKCYCQDGYNGERCQSSRCAGYCLNDGKCSIERRTGDPTCECSDNFVGARCEQNSTEICSLLCRILQHEPETYVPYGCHDICEELATQTDENGQRLYAIPKYQHLEACRNPNVWTVNVIMSLIAGIVACLALIALTVHSLRRFYKPARPYIKKTFVVRKQARTNSTSDTPLTNRPMSTEQCEITIENCCNMNICDTPCFDPKIVEKTFACESKPKPKPKQHAKEDKKTLVDNMENESY